MPYIDKGVRASLEQGRKPTTGGELNYLISSMLSDFVAMKGQSYATINEAMGALACAQSEFYRKVAADYENFKELTNGTVWNYKQEKQ